MMENDSLLGSAGMFGKKVMREVLKDSFDKETIVKGSD